MIPKIDQFYLDSNYGVMKFVGYSPEGNLMFERFVKSYEDMGWLPMGQRVNLDPQFQTFRFKQNQTRPIPPPQ
jgi:hypothetical protein